MKISEKLVSMLTNKERAEYIIEELKKRDGELSILVHNLYYNPKESIEKWLESEYKE